MTPGLAGTGSPTPGRGSRSPADPAFLDQTAIAGAQLTWTWRELELERGHSDFSEVRTQLEQLARHGKRPWVQLADVTFSERPPVSDCLLDDPVLRGGSDLLPHRAGHQQDSLPLILGLVDPPPAAFLEREVVRGAQQRAAREIPAVPSWGPTTSRSGTTPCTTTPPVCWSRDAGSLRPSWACHDRWVLPWGMSPLEEPVMLSLTRRALLGCALLAVALPPPARAQRESRTVRIDFDSSRTGATITDSIRGYAFVDYLLGARAGQRLAARMTTSNGANYFNLMAPGEDVVAFFNGSMAENRYTGILTKSGDYTIRVYLMRSAARRNEVGRFRLEVTVVDTGAGGGPAGPGA